VSDTPSPASLELKLTGFDVQKPTSSVNLKDSKPSQRICDLCRRIDFKSALGSNIRGKAIGNGPFICNLDHINRDSDCSICAFFREMRIYPPQRDGRDLRFSLVAFSALTQLRLSGLGIQDAVMLAVVGRSFANSLSEDDRHGYSLGPYIMSSAVPLVEVATPAIRGRALDPKIIDCSVIVDWVDFCRLNHSRRCPKMETHTIDGFRVIDCEMRQVVTAPECCEYIALSYVWGDSEAKDLLSRNIIPDLTHPVIEDSITVTMRLGFRYLWGQSFLRQNYHPTLRAESVLGVRP